MTPAPDSSSTKPTLESLLRLKRAERPDDAFWGEFEVRMRQKQLAASIEPKPWWLGATLVLRRFSMPLMTGAAGAAGAAAVLGFMVVRSTSATDEGGYAIVQADVTPLAEVAALADASDLATLELADSSSVRDVQVSPVLVDATKAVESAVNEWVLAAEPTVSEISSEVAGPMDSQGADDTAAVGTTLLADAGSEMEETSSSLILTAQVKLVDDVFASLAQRLEATSWTVAQLVSPVEDFGMTTALDAQPAVSGFSVGEASNPAPAPSSRLEQLLAMDESKPAAHKSLVQVRDRVLHRFGGEEELYASVSRLGVGGDRLSLRF